MKTSAKLEVQLVVDACKRVGVTKVVLSPGSRNAPLTIAFDEDDHFEVFVIPDERAAAFYALGMAQQLEQPVVIACTSGSAPLNYYPAVVEAFYQGVPMIVLTADRPSEWVDQGDGQTIRQQNVYGEHVLKSAQMDPIFTENHRWHFERKLAEVLQAANAAVKGPVHLNLPFSEPLYETTSEQHTLKNWIHQAETRPQFAPQEINRLSILWHHSVKRLVIVGQMAPDILTQRALEQLAKDGSTAILVEHTANAQHPYFVECIDRALNLMDESELSHYYPELIVAIGGAVVSKKIKRFLRDSKAPVIKFGDAFPFMDTFQNLVFSAQVPAHYGLECLNQLVEKQPAVSSFGFKWKKLDYQAELKHQEILPQIPFSDLKVMETLLDVIPDDSHVHISNSSMIRYALLFNPVKTFTYWCNRGTSGIDGSSSTACGAALIKQKQCHVLITGDLSFFYDSNAFWNSQLPSNLRVVVVNNGGGDIFNIIPGPSTTNQLDKVFVAKHDFKAKSICEAYGVEHFEAKTIDEMEDLWSSFFEFSENGSPKLLEIHTQNQNNSVVLKDYFIKCKG
ncbi:MAG: 2-succinyl-5-enolpyruvyl-6-hydroxy-3-cyclohexene-1-carboxylic-acid synthase [Fluviicola sp.]|nr:2-succinyl-5-enolpyruvyl-6-hydroxy-3-cyclohexene-1-carboxylic-acid synthase [Fluviicola sp.]